MNLRPRIPIPLELPHEAFEGLHQALAKVRSTSTTVTVNKDALATLLRDYSNLINKLETSYKD